VFQAFQHCQVFPRENGRESVALNRKGLVTSFNGNVPNYEIETLAF